MAPLEETDLQAAAVSAGIPAERVDAAINKA
jgi:hypothetical protein